MVCLATIQLALEVANGLVPEWYLFLCNLRQLNSTQLQLDTNNNNINSCTCTFLSHARLEIIGKDKDNKEVRAGEAYDQP